MSYFKDFPLQFYSFGDEGETALVQNIATYVEILDDIKLNQAFYQDYYIQGGERADQVAFMLYKNPHLHWTFYIMNDKIREQGWPLGYEQVVEKTKTDYPNYVLTTQEPIHSVFNVGDTLTGSISNAVGVVKYKNLDLGQIHVEMSGVETFQQGELAVYGTDFVTINSSVQGHLAVRYYLLEGERVDLDLTDMSVPTNAVPKTNLEFYLEENDKLKQIRVIKPNSVNTIQKLFKEALRS